MLEGRIEQLDHPAHVVAQEDVVCGRGGGEWKVEGGGGERVRG